MSVPADSRWARVRGVLHRFWFAPSDPISASLFRIFLGLLLVVHFIALYPNWERFYAADGMLSLTQLESTRQAESHRSVFYWSEGVVPVKAWWWVGFVVASSFAAGWNTRLSTILLYVLQVSTLNRNRLAMNGEDLSFRMLLFYSCFAPLGHSLSVDCWRRTGRVLGTGSAEALPSIWPVRLLQVNVALVYALSLPHKLVGDSAWLDGTAIYWTMMNDTWSRWPGQSLFYGGFFCAVLSYGTIITEGLFPLLVWFRTTRPWVLGAITCMHLGIALLLQNITFFSLSMICSFWVFVPPASVRMLVEHLPAIRLPKPAKVQQA